MLNLGLNNGKTNGIPNCCHSCVKGEPEGDIGEIRCNKGTLMKPFEYCEEFRLDTIKTPEQVIEYVQEYINKNSGI